MRYSKLRIYPPIIVTALALLVFSAVAVASIVAEAEQQAATQPQQTAEPMDAQARPTVGPITTPEITQEPQNAPEPTYSSAIHSRDWDGEESQMLMKIAMAEAEGESVEGKALVMLVVLNRVWSGQFPDTIEAVIFQNYNGVWQFSPVAEGGRYWTTEPDDGCREALELVLDGWDESQGALYFESTGKDGWHSQNLELLFQYGGHKFYR